MHSQCTVQRAPTVIRVWHCGSVVWPRAQHHRGIAGGCAAGAGLTEPRNAPVELHARGVSRSSVALSSGLLGQHTDARQWRREHYIRNPYIHTCRVKISTFPWRPVSCIDFRSVKQTPSTAPTVGLPPTAARTCHRLLRAHLRRDVQLGFRCRLRRRRPRLGFRPARADGMWATGPSSHMLK